MKEPSKQNNSLGPWRKHKPSRLDTQEMSEKPELSQIVYATTARQSTFVDESIISYQPTNPRDTPPKVVKQVEEWLTDRNAGQLVLQKYQEVAIARTSRNNQYKGKTSSPTMKVELTEVGNFAGERMPSEIGSALLDEAGKRATPLSSMH